MLEATALYAGLLGLLAIVLAVQIGRVAVASVWAVVSSL